MFICSSSDYLISRPVQIAFSLWTMPAATEVEAKLQQIEGEVAVELDDAVEHARSSPDTTPDQALEDVYA